MTVDDHRKIRIGEHDIGIIGLAAALEEVASGCSGADQEEIKARLVSLLKAKNYIPSSAEKLYGEAFLREYRKWKGEAVQESESQDLKVVILGPGCAQCNDLEQAVLQELGRLNIPAAVEHVTDIKEIARYGIVRTPALVVNGKIASAGIVPNSRRLREILLSLTKS